MIDKLLRAEINVDQERCTLLHINESGFRLRFADASELRVVRWLFGYRLEVVNAKGETELGYDAATARAADAFSLRAAEGVYMAWRAAWLLSTSTWEEEVIAWDWKQGLVVEKRGETRHVVIDVRRRD